jgi:hypothetical protein
MTDRHVVPTNDRQSHLWDEDCPCSPTIKVYGDDRVIVHNAWDYREIIEQAVAILNGDWEDFLHACGTCGRELQEVRPGKYQCVYCEE